MDIIDKIELEELIKEASYVGNLGAVEMMQFYQKATDADIKKMEYFLKKGSLTGIKKLFKKILGIELKKIT